MLKEAIQALVKDVYHQVHQSMNINISYDNMCYISKLYKDVCARCKYLRTAWTSKLHPHYRCDVITCPCPRYVFLAHTTTYISNNIYNTNATWQLSWCQFFASVGTLDCHNDNFRCCQRRKSRLHDISRVPVCYDNHRCHQNRQS